MNRLFLLLDTIYYTVLEPIMASTSPIAPSTGDPYWLGTPT
jgi:hypothetical protein